MKKINWGLVITSAISLFVVVGIGFHMYDDYMTSKFADLAEMSSNRGECRTYGCIFRSHDNGYETIQQAMWYDIHITRVHKQERDAHLAWVASMEKRGYTIDADVRHAYDHQY